MISYDCLKCGKVSSTEVCYRCSDESGRATSAQVEELMAILLGQQVDKELRRRRKARKPVTTPAAQSSVTSGSLETTLRIRRTPMEVS